MSHDSHQEHLGGRLEAVLLGREAAALGKVTPQNTVPLLSSEA